MASPGRWECTDAVRRDVGEKRKEHTEKKRSEISQVSESYLRKH